MENIIIECESDGYYKNISTYESGYLNCKIWERGMAEEVEFLLDEEEQIKLYDFLKVKFKLKLAREKFKQDYLTDAFYFVETEEEFISLQKIGLEFGFTNPIGETSLIAYDMHDVCKKIAPEPGVKVAKNLTFFPEGRFQESGFWVCNASYGEPKKSKQCIDAYNKLNTNGV